MQQQVILRLRQNSNLVSCRFLAVLERAILCRGKERIGRAPLGRMHDCSDTDARRDDPTDTRAPRCSSITAMCGWRQSVRPWPR